MTSFDAAFDALSATAQHHIREVAAYAILSSHLNDPTTPVTEDAVEVVSKALAISYKGDEKKIERQYQSIMRSRVAMERSLAS